MKLESAVGACGECSGRISVRVGGECATERKEVLHRLHHVFRRHVDRLDRAGEYERFEGIVTNSIKMTQTQTSAVVVYSSIAIEHQGDKQRCLVARMGAKVSEVPCVYEFPGPSRCGS